MKDLWDNSYDFTLAKFSTKHHIPNFTSFPEQASIDLISTMHNFLNSGRMDIALPLVIYQRYFLKSST
jgi:hypothetical protein